MSITDAVDRRWAPVQPAALRRTVKLVQADAPIYAVIAGFVVLVLTLSLQAGQIGSAQFFAYLATSLRFAVSLLVVCFVGQALIVGIFTDPREPLRSVLAAMRWDRLPLIAAGLILFLVETVSYGASTTLKNLLPIYNDFVFDEALADIDRALHLGVDPWRLLQPFIADPTIRGSIEFLYSVVWGAEFNMVTLLMAAYCRDRQLRDQYFLACLSCWILLGGLVAGLFLSGGPVFYHHFTGDAERFQDLITFLATDPGLFGAVKYQAYLWDMYESGLTGFGSGISAFPSLHVAMAGLCAILLWRLNRILGVAGWVFAFLILFGSVALGWHYAIDGYASLLGVAVLWRIAGRVAGYRARRVGAIAQAVA